jgi:hypothetical protein
MRDPIMRAYSEWSMFALGWHWDRDLNLLGRLRSQIRAFRVCSAGLFHNMSALQALPTSELFGYVTRCFRGKAMEYVSNSIYSVCVLAALRVFKREQFLFLRFEDVMRMEAGSLLKLLSNFTGLYTDDSIIGRAKQAGQCEAPRAKKKPLSFSKTNSSDASRAKAAVRGAMKEIEDFYAPYNQLLSTLVHPAFQWGRGSHEL